MPLADLARSLLDTPRWVETRFMLLRGEATITGLSADRRRFVATSARWPLMAVVGRPEPAFIAAAAARAGPLLTVLCAEEDADHVAPALPEWARAGAGIHAWPGSVPLPEASSAPEAQLLEPAALAGLDHLPTTLHEELITAADYSPIAVTYQGGVAASFCYATSITESLWDVSIDTLEPWRRRGLAAQAFRLLAATLGARGKWPVWGCDDENEPSVRLAAKLGFVPAGRLALFSGVPTRWPSAGAALGVPARG